MSLKIKPLGDRVVVERVEPEVKSAGGIIIPETAQEAKGTRGKVVAVGPGGLNDKGERIHMDVKPGDDILFGKWSGTEVKIDGHDYLIMKESDIMGIITG